MEGDTRSPLEEPHEDQPVCPLSLSNLDKLEYVPWNHAERDVLIPWQTDASQPGQNAQCEQQVMLAQDCYSLPHAEGQNVRETSKKSHSNHENQSQVFDPNDGLIDVTQTENDWIPSHDVYLAYSEEAFVDQQPSLEYDPDFASVVDDHQYSDVDYQYNPVEAFENQHFDEQHPCQVQAETQYIEEENGTFNQLFELDHIESRDEVIWRIERLIVHLMDQGYVECAVPMTRQRFNDNGCLRVATRTRRIYSDSSSLAKALHVLSICHDLLLENKTATVREVFYRHKTGLTPFEDMASCNRSIQLACYLTRCSRESLHLLAPSRGLVSGIQIQNLNHMTPVPSFRTFDDLNWLVDELTTRESPPGFVLVIEKYTVFHRFIQSDFFKSVPCIAVTGRGFPDLETRKFVRFLRERLDLACLGLCDYNPFGLGLMGTYAYGSTSMAGEAFRYVIPDLVVLGLTSQDAMENGVAFQPLTMTDLKALKGLEEIAQVMGNDYLRNEVEVMRRNGVKMELDSFENIASGFLFEEWLPRKVESAANLFELF